MCRSTILKANQVSSKNVSMRQTIVCILRHRFVSHEVVFGSNSDVFSSCLKQEESGEMPGAIVLPDEHKAKTDSVTKQNIFCVSSCSLLNGNKLRETYDRLPR